MLSEIEVMANLKSFEFIEFVLLFDLNKQQTVADVKKIIRINGMIAELNKSAHNIMPWSFKMHCLISTVKFDVLSKEQLMLNSFKSAIGK